MDRTSYSHSYSYSDSHFKFHSDESSSIVSTPSDTEDESVPSTKRTTLAKEPVMVSRSHLFDGLPADISTMFLQNHLLVPGNDDLSAKNLRQHACINQAHRQYVSELFRRDDMREIAFCSTKQAIPSLLQKLNLNKNLRIKNSEIDHLIEAAPRLYVDCSFDKFIYSARGERLLRKIVTHPGLMELRLDHSMPDGAEFLKIREKRPMVFNDLKQFIEKGFGLSAIKLIKEKSLNQENLKVDFSFRNWCPNSRSGPEDPMWKFFSKKFNFDTTKNLLVDVFDLGRDIKLNKSYIDLQSLQMEVNLDGIYGYFDYQIFTLKFLCDFAIGNHANVLLLDGLFIGDRDASGLIKEMMKNDKNSLRHLDFSSNKIADSGIKMLLKFMEFNTSLERIILSNNQISDKEADLLLKMLTHNKNLAELRLDRNNISDDHPIWDDPRAINYD